MYLFSLVIRNLRFYRKPYFAIFAGTVLSTAVLTGALVVGDSVRYSLSQLIDIRLGKTRFAIQSGDRFFRQQLAPELATQAGSQVVAILQLEGMAVNSGESSRINQVEVLGIDDHFMKLWNTDIPQPADDEAIISRNSADKLNLKPGDEFVLKLHKQSKASENAPFISEKEPLVTFRLKVASIADDVLMGSFSLKTNQSAPYNIFISLPALARKTELDGNANVLLIANNKIGNLTSGKLDSLLRLCLQPEDAGLEFNPLPGTKRFEMRSGRIFIEDNIAQAIEKAIPEAEAVFTYLVNDISSNGKSTPYSFVTATDIPELQLSEKEIIINNWLASDLFVKMGDSIQLKYFKMGAMRKLIEDSSRFCVKYILPVTNSIFDPTLMPDFPGMSDAGNCRDWETGAPVELDKIRDKDEQYWNDYRGTPKAFVSFASGQKLWDNAFGHATAFRFQADSSSLPPMKRQIMNQLIPAENGLRVQDIYTEGKSAAANSTDFGSLFLSLSFFIIAAALLLIALLFSLHARKRMSETAIMAALGFRKKYIFRILFLEAALVVLIGSVFGVFGGILYNKLMLQGLNTLWQDAVRTSVLQMHLIPGTLFTGFAAGTVTASLTLLFVLIINFRKPLSVLIKGVEVPSPDINRKRKTISFITAIFLFVVALGIILVSFAGSQSHLSVNFLSAGGLILIAGITMLYSMLLHTGQKMACSKPGFYTTIVRNISMNKSRTIAAVSLLAIGTFTVMITGANRKTFYGSENNNQSGTGGFLFWAETTIPVLHDLNTQEGKEKYGISDEKDLLNLHFTQLPGLIGNDASCLNLNQVLQPTILGIEPKFFDQKQSFSFINLLSTVSEKHPWLTLNEPVAPGMIPAFADQTVITWGLHKKVGDTLIYTVEKGKILKVKLMAGLANSVFQGNILISAELFHQYFPSAAGSKIMLIDGDFAQRKAISERLEYLFQDFGMVVTPASARLAEFNSVTNTYLSVFMLLSGLGILVGTIGLGIVLLKNLEERKREIAIYMALGFKRIYILKLILTENLFILLAGIVIGLLAAFAGIMPSFFSPAFQLPATFLLVILFLIFISGFAWIYIPLSAVLRKTPVQALRQE